MLLHALTLLTLLHALIRSTCSYTPHDPTRSYTLHDPTRSYTPHDPTLLRNSCCSALPLTIIRKHKIKQNSCAFPTPALSPALHKITKKCSPRNHCKTTLSPLPASNTLTPAARNTLTPAARNTVTPAARNTLTPAARNTHSCS